MVYILIIVSILLLTGGTPQADEGLSAAEVRLFEKINQARVNPLETAASLGMSPDQLLKDLPELKDILINGLPPFAPDTKLTQAARSHTADMLAKGYYSHDSLDGRSYNERISQAGFSAGFSGESLGLVGFFNYMPDEQAADAIFENLFQDELKPGTGRRTILDPNLKDLGLGMGKGQLDLGFGLFNAYVVTCDFGTLTEPESFELMERQLVHLINQFRDRGMDVIREMGIDPESIPDELTNQFNTGIPPVVLNENLSVSARLHAAHVLGQEYFSSISPDGRTPEDRMREQGYEPVVSDEVLVRIDLEENGDPNVVVKKIFETLAQELIDRGGGGVINPEFKEIGIGLSSRIEILEGKQVKTLAAVIDLGTETGNEDVFISGLAFQDGNGNGLYDPGEGQNRVPIIVYGAGLHLATDETGGVTAAVAPGYYWVIRFSQTEEPEIREINVKEKNEWFSYLIDKIVDQ